MADSPDWHKQAECQHHDPNMWFPTDDRFEQENVARAKTICRSCPVINECAEWGVRHENYGIWGGMTANELDAERKRRGVKRDPLDSRLEPCGTPAAARRHGRRGEEVCALCKDGERRGWVRRASA